MELKQGYALVVAEHRISYLMECRPVLPYGGRADAGSLATMCSPWTAPSALPWAFAALLSSPAFLEACLRLLPRGLAREGERKPRPAKLSARLEAASLEVDGLAVSRGGNLLFSCVCFAMEPGQIMALTGKTAWARRAWRRSRLARPTRRGLRARGRAEAVPAGAASPRVVQPQRREHGVLLFRVDEEVLLFSDQDDAARRYADHVLEAGPAG